MFRRFREKVREWLDKWVYSWWYKDYGDPAEERDEKLAQGETENGSIIAALIDFFRTMIQLIVCRRAVEERLEQEAKKEAEEWSRMEKSVGNDGAHLDALISAVGDRTEPKKVHHIERDGR